ncbi:hypothetical protein EJB05_28648, partial [Eragrostis curvula]
MPATSSRIGGGANRLSTLADEILQQILSFLPAHEAVRTCVLARSWRNVWKLMRRLCITGTSTPASVQQVGWFVSRLFFIRHCELDKAPLDACKIIFEDFGDHDDPLISSHLTRLELNGIQFIRSFADFSSCPALQDLQCSKCDFTRVAELVSPSLKWLMITGCCFGQRSRLRISAPHLVSLKLDDPSVDRTPLLESMPDLVGAYVRTSCNMDSCYCADRMDCTHIMGGGSDSETDSDVEISSGDDDDNSIVKSVLLGGLSEATNLTLMSVDTMYIFRRDLRWCPTFLKLKTLLLNDYWCGPDDCRPLACILEHSPVLEKLIILFSRNVEPEYKVEMKGCLDNSIKRPIAISEHIKIVKVKCNMVNERFHNLMKFLQVSLNI